MTWYVSRAVHIDDDYVVFYKDPMIPLSEADYIAIQRAVDNAQAIMLKYRNGFIKFTEEIENEFDKNFLYKLGIKE